MLTHPIENDTEVPVWEHLDELRARLMQCLVSTVVLTGCAYYFSDQLVHFLEKPLLGLLPNGEQSLYYTGLTDKVFIYLKVSFLTSVALNVPLYLFQIWKFVSPALKTTERQSIVPFLFFGSTAFVVGLVFCYTIVLPSLFQYLVTFGAPTEKPIITLTSYFDLTLHLLLAMGLLFEVPIVIVILAKMGIVNSFILIKFRRYFLFVNAVFSSLLTPGPDFISLALLMVPIALLYEIGILAVYSLEKGIIQPLCHNEKSAASPHKGKN